MYNPRAMSPTAKRAIWSITVFVVIALLSIIIGSRLDGPDSTQRNNERSIFPTLKP